MVVYSYKIIRSNYATAFENTVQKHLMSGWKFAKGFSSNNIDNEKDPDISKKIFIYNQAMYKEALDE